MARQHRDFNFRDVAKVLGLDVTDPRAAWALGHKVRAIAADLGHEPDRKLSEKSDPDPTVAAPHCIAHYPFEIFKRVCDQIEFDRSGGGQLDLFGP